MRKGKPPLPTPPYAQILASINGAAAASGGLFASFGQSVVLSAANTTGWNQALWQIYDYPPGFTTPSGWSIDSSGIIYVQPTNPTTPPPSFSLPASGSSTWGKYALRLRINGNPLQYLPSGAPNASYVPAYTDESTMICIPSPSKGMNGVAFNETTQYDPLRSAVGEIMQALRLLD